MVIAAYGPERAALHRAISDAFAEVGRIDRQLSRHRQDSELARLNARAADGPAGVSPELFRVVAMGQQIAADSDGSFDLTIAPLAELWGFVWKDYRLPSNQELAAPLSRVNYRWVELDHGASAIRFLHPGVSLDLGGLAKGYAVDCAVKTLHAAGVTNLMVRAGGDLRVTGAPPGRSSWAVQLEDPSGSGCRDWIELRDAAISTSGDYENFFMVDGRRYSHILDPRTGLPVEGIASCALIAPTCLESDGWATAAFVLGAERSLETLGDRYPMRFTLRPAGDGGQWTVRQSARFPLTHPGDKAKRRLGS